jgi:PAS domain S-box-containing protein
MGSPTRILFVDDEPAFRDALSELLRHEGYEVSTASTGSEALVVLRQNLPELILLDVMLPDIRGTELCRTVKSDPAFAGTFIVLLSGIATSSAETVKGLEVGADDYIPKTIQPGELLARLRTLVRLRDTTAALRQREQHYRGLVEILPDAVILTDRRGKIVTVNPQALAILGYAESDLIGRPLIELATASDRARIKTELELTFDTGVMRHAEYDLCRWSGAALPVEVSAAVMRDAEGKVSGLVAVLRDITQRKLSERLLRERAEFNRRIISTAMDGFWMIDVQGRFMDVNESYCAMSGYSLRELLSMGIWEVDVNEPTPDHVVAHIAHVMKNGSDRFETRHRRKDGRIFDVEVSTTYLHVAEGYLFAFLRDITDRKQARQRLADALELNESIMAASSIGIAAYKASGPCIFSNEAASRILGSGPSPGLMPSFGAESSWQQSGLLRLAQQALQAREVQHGEFQFKKASGEQVWLDCHADTFLSGGEQHLLLMVSDVTKRKQAEEELKRMPRRIIEAQEAEHLRVSRELHEGVNQIIAAAKMRLHTVLEKAGGTMRPSIREILARCERMLVQSLEENRRIAHNLRPTDLDELGFDAACLSFCRDFEAGRG